MRRGGLTIVVALAGVLACAAPPALAAEPTKKELTFEVTVGPANDTKCTVTADLYTPPGASKANPVPALMGTNGFGGSKNDYSSLGPSYARRGYAFLAYSGLGFGNSGCKITLDDPDWDGKAGSQLLSFLGGTKAARDGTKIDYVVLDGAGDPRVGMIGGSYGGQIQFAIAGIDKRLDAIVPQITWNDLAYSLVPNNHDFERGVTYKTTGVSKSDWPALFTALGLGQGFQQAVQNQDPSHLGACPNFTDQVCESLVTSAATGYADAKTIALLRHASVSSYITKIRIPTLLSQGQSDTLFDIQEATATYKTLRAQGTPVKMLWRSSGHSGGSIPGESNSKELESAYESRMALEWFDYYLRGIGDPPALDFSFIRDWVKYQGDAAPSVGVTPSYPAGADRTVFLSGGDSIVPAKEGVKAGTASFAVSPGATGTGGAAIAQPPAENAPGTFAAFESAPLGEDFDLVGIPRVTVKIDAPTFAQTQSADPGTKLVLFAKLLDVAPDGAATLPRNLLSAVRVTDVTKPVEIELPGISYRFARGHSMRLVISASNSTNRGNNASGPVSIVSDPAVPNALVLPKLGAQRGATGAAPGGMTAFEPAPGAPVPQKPGKRRRVLTAASLSGNTRCVKRRAVALRIVRHKGENQAASAVITVNGKRVRTVTGRRLLSKVRLERMPKRGAYRVLVTVRTKGGKTLRSARTYRAC
ncbi:MAG TPA: alpha/beta fold hydrolase [Thermoleophilaceae bacterium]|jgi:ABC-2 type transport system ATP-binding protein